MAFAPIQMPRGLRATMDDHAAASSLLEGEVRYLTDEKKLVVATGTDAYVDVGAGGYVVSSASTTTLSLAMANKTLLATYSGTTFPDIRIPANSAVPFPIGTRIQIERPNADLGLAIGPESGSGVVIYSADESVILPGCGGYVVKTGTDEWLFVNHSHYPRQAIAFGAVYRSSAAGTPSVSFPAHVEAEAGDLCLIFAETAAQAVNTPTGFTAIPGLPQTTGAAGGTASTALYGFYRIVDGSESAVSVGLGSSGDHLVAASFIVKKVDPVNALATTASSVASSATTAVSFPTVTTSRNDNLIICVVANATDASAPQLSNPANAALSGIQTIFDRGVTGGNGGGISIVTGVKSSPGATGATTGTLATASVQARCTIAINAR